MRLVHVTIPTGKLEAIRRVLDEEGADYVVTEESSDREYVAVVTFPLPTNAVEHVLERLREAGLPEDAPTVVIDAETVISRQFEAQERRYAADEATDERISREEVAARAADLAPARWTFVAMTVASVMIATAGVLLDSAAVVVGSMVIAPLIGPAMATSVGTVLQERDLFERGVRLQAIGFVLAIVTAALFAYVLKSAHLVNVGPDELVNIGGSRRTSSRSSWRSRRASRGPTASPRACPPRWSGSPSPSRWFRRPPSSASGSPGGSPPWWSARPSWSW